MHSSTVLASSPRRLLPQAAVCSAGILLGVLSYHLLKRSESNLRPYSEISSVAPNTTIERLPSRSLPPAPAAALTRPSSDEAELSRQLRKILHTGGQGYTRQFKQLVTWAENASEAELKLAMKLNTEALLKDESQREMLDTVALGRLAEIDGEMAVEVMRATEHDRPVAYDAQQALYQGWASWDPRGALKAALNRIEKGEDRSASLIVGGVLTEVSREFPHLAREVASELARFDDEALRDIGFRAHADQMLQQLDDGGTLASALAWIAATQVSPAEREHLLGSLVERSLSNENPQEALVLFRQMAPIKDPDLAGRLMMGLVATDPASAKQILLSVPEGNPRQYLASRLVEQLADQESPAAAFNWLVAQPAHPDFNGAFETLAEAFGEVDRRSAWACLTKISPGAEGQNRLAHEFAFKWLKADFSAASAELPPQYVDRYQRSAALLEELARTVPEISEEFALTWNRNLIPVIHGHGPISP